MRKIILMLALLLPTLAMASPTSELLARLHGLHSVSGQFQQTVLDKDGTQLQNASGEMTVARGNRFYWHTKKPYSQLAVSDGKQVWVYDQDLEQVVIKPLNKDLSKTPALLFGGDPSSVAKAFNVSIRDRDGNSVTFQLKPKGGDPLFDVLDVTFDGNKPSAMRLEDALGQKTVIQFQNLSLNVSPPASRFHFDPPKGTDVIRQ